MLINTIRNVFCTFTGRNLRLFSLVLGMVGLRYGYSVQGSIFNSNLMNSFYIQSWLEVSSVMLFIGRIVFPTVNTISGGQDSSESFIRFRLIRVKLHDHILEEPVYYEFRITCLLCTTMDGSDLWLLECLLLKLIWVFKLLFLVQLELWYNILRLLIQGQI